MVRLLVNPDNIDDAHAANNSNENKGDWHKAPYAVEISEFDRLAKIMLKERQDKGFYRF
jgi:hypothetical protein